ncbi:LARP7 family protein [Megaselia abdita]
MTPKIEKENNEASDKDKKTVRHRKKKFYNDIRQQIEFYFGDANLAKDRFVRELIQKDPYVPLSVFLTFNKIKKFTTSLDEIRKSLETSTFLKLSEDGDKVRRITEIQENRDVDGKTLYVEALPTKADHDWIKSSFSKFGPVTYVSLPRYKVSKRIKEFAFIEFEKDESVEKAMKFFKEFGGCLCLESTDPGKLMSVTTFIKEQNNEDSNEENQSNSEEPPMKKAKLENTESSTAGETETEDKDEKEGETSEKKKSRKRRKKKKVSSTYDGELKELRILPKREWKKLRNKYLNLQREKASELKRLAWKNAQHAQEHPAEQVSKGPANFEISSMNFYGAIDPENERKSPVKVDRKNPALEKAPLFSYEPGLIVNVKFLEPCVNIKEFKADMKQYECVKYVDIKEGALEAFLRCESGNAASDFVKQINCAEYNCAVISGDQESEYWMKIKNDREMKLNKKVKVPVKKRGRDRVAKIAAKHIRFGDDAEDNTEEQEGGENNVNLDGID